MNQCQDGQRSANPVRPKLVRPSVLTLSPEEEAEEKEEVETSKRRRRSPGPCSAETWEQEDEDGDRDGRADVEDKPDAEIDGESACLLAERPGRGHIKPAQGNAS